MSIDIQPPNYSGLVNLAGKATNLNIQPTGALGLQALQQQQANAANLRANALGRDQLQQQGQLGLLSQFTQNRALDLQAQQQRGLLSNNAQQQAIELAKLQQKAGMDQNQLALDMAKYQQTGANQDTVNAINEQKNMLDAHKQQMEQLNKDSLQTLKEKGAYASYGLLALKNAKTPEEANAIKAEIVKEAQAKKYISADDAKNILQMPNSQAALLLGSIIVSTGTAADYKRLMDAQKTPNGTDTTVTLADGTVVHTSAATKPTESKAQSDIMGAKDNLAELNNLYKNVPPNYFGLPALKQTSTYLRELGQVIPGIGPSEENKSDLKKYSGLQGASEMMSMNVIKQLSGVQYSDKQLEFMKKILPEFGPTSAKSVFDGRVENLQRFFEQTKKAREEVLAQGFQSSNDPDSPYAKALLEKMQQNAISPVDPRMQKIIDAGYPKEKIESALAAGHTMDEIAQHVGVK